MAGWRGDDDDENGVADGSPADLFENQLVSEAAPFRDIPMRAGPGRPKGSINRRTLDMRELYLRSGFPHPLLWQGHMLRQGIDGLTRQLSCNALEAADLLRKIAADALPYLESKMPAKLDVKTDKRPVLVVEDLNAAAIEARQDGVMAIDDDLVEAVKAYQQDQGLSETDREKSHAKQSHTEGEAAD